MISALLIHGVPIECINRAAITYMVPAKVIISVLETENGKNGQAKLNKNGTFDYGVMQINSIWLKSIEPYGYNMKAIRYNPCANVAVGAWILSQRIAHSENLWEGIGGYHSYTPALNANYQAKIFHRLDQINEIIGGII
jgi:soluble lytic murein transglycosylase-like protein